MADNTKIEWADATVNYLNGCSVISAGCTNCYAMRLAGTRLKHDPSRAGLTMATKAGPVWTGETRANEKALLLPLKWKRARRIFWNAHGDLFHDSVPDAVIDLQWAVMALTPQHTHMVLTKRPERMREYLDNPTTTQRLAALLLEKTDRQWGVAAGTILLALANRSQEDEPELITPPLPNVWLGTSVEDQRTADERISHLLATPAAVRFLSCEPLLGPVDLTRINFGQHDNDDDVRVWDDALTGDVWSAFFAGVGGLVGVERGGNDGPVIDWVIAGGESGPGARPMHPDWARSLRDQCAAAGVAFHFKQWGESGPLRPELIPVPWGKIGWVAKDGRFKFGCTEADHEPMYKDDDKFGPSYWSQIVRVGKARAGRLLDGRTHDEFPGAPN